MKFPVRLFIQRHDSRSYTVSAPALPGISAYGPTLEECKQEVAEAIVKRLAELDPDSLHAYAMPSGQTLERATVELRPTDRHGKRRRDTVRLTISLLLTPEEGGQILVSVPTLRYPPLSFYVKGPDELHEVAQLELIQYFHGDALESIVGRQAARYETLDVLEVEFRPKKVAEREEEQEQESFWALKASGVNLTAQAAEGQLRRAYRREKELDAVVAAITSDRRPSILLIGPSGAGKTAIVHELARRIRAKETPEALHDRQVWAVTGESILAGCQFLGQWEEKLGDLVREVRKRRHILFVEDVASLAEAGRHHKSDNNMADFLKTHVQTGDVVIVGETTPERLRRAEQLTPGFIAQLRTLEVPPTGEADTLSILAALARELERAEEVRIEPAALEAARELSERFLPYRAHPGKAVALVEQIVADRARERGTAGAPGRAAIGRKEVIAGFTRQTGLPEFMLADSQPLDLAAVRAHFAERIIGQEGAVDAMVDLIAVVKAGLNDPEKPLGVYLFIGPTGVGKTQLAKTLAAYLFGDARRMVRFDMSEYSDPAAVRRLIGMPGMGREGGEGELTRAVRAQPFCVLLLDEFEKADPQIFDIFLQVLGEGRLTDASGATTSFQNAIVIMTSNLGASAREQRGIGLAPGGRREPDGAEGDAGLAPPSGRLAPHDYWQRKVEQHFRPEFVNRIDQIVSFKALDEGAMRTIASREIGEVLLRQGFVRRNVLVEIDDNVIDLLLEQGFTATYGARPLKRAIERLLVLPLARYLAARDKPGADLLRLRRAGDRIELQAATLADSSADVLLEGAGDSVRRRRLDDKGLAQGFADQRRKLHDLAESAAVAAMADERATALAETNRPSFWDDGDRARRTLARFYTLDRLLKRLQQLRDRAEYLEELANLVQRQRDPRYRGDLAGSYEGLHRDLAFLEVELLCAHLEDNHKAVVRVRRVGAPARGDEGEPWTTALAAMYLRWGARKGYDLSLFILEPMGEEERRRASMLAQHYPHRWRPIDTGDLDEALRQLARLDEPAEIALGLEGTNVYGFLKGELGVHRRSDKRAGGERVQRLAEVVVSAPGDDPPDLWLERLLLARAMEEHERAGLTRKQLAALPAPPEPAVIRVYQIEGERVARDLRTQARTTDVAGLLAGALDDFILAYLREEEARQAWG